MSLAGERGFSSFARIQEEVQMSAEKNKDLRETRAYDYGSTGRVRRESGGGEDSGRIYVIERYRDGWVWVNGIMWIAVLVGIVGLVWICSGVWEDVGYLLEYGSCTEMDGGLVEYELDIVERVDGGG